MKYTAIVATFVKQVPLFVEMYDKKLVKLSKRETSGVDVLARWDTATPETKRYMEIVTEMADVAIKIETYLTTMILGPGPKIFRPTAEQCFALERMKLTLDVADFAMPFETMVIEWPEEYLKARCDKTVVSALHYHKESSFFIHSNMYRDGTAYKAWHPINPGQEVESWFKPHDFKDMGAIPVTLDERETEEIFRRVALNYCLLLDEVGCHLVGPNSPNQYSELVRLSRNNKVFAKHNKINIRMHPMVYTIDREVQLVKVVASEGELPPETTGRSLSPHCRRGFYKMQPHGPNNSLRKRIRIPSVIVNKYLLVGPPPSQEYRS